MPTAVGGGVAWTKGGGKPDEGGLDWADYYGRL